MEIEFTFHAIEKIEERDIALGEIMRCLNAPDKIRVNNEISIYIKLAENQRKVLIVICTIAGDRCKIITAIKSSKINKYL